MDVPMFDLLMLQFDTCFSIECNNMLPIPCRSAKPLSYRVVADIAIFLGIMRIVTQAGVEEVDLETNAVICSQPMLPVCD